MYVYILNRITIDKCIYRRWPNKLNVFILIMLILPFICCNQTNQNWIRPMTLATLSIWLYKQHIFCLSLQIISIHISAFQSHIRFNGNPLVLLTQCNNHLFHRSTHHIFYCHRHCIALS